MYSKKKKTWFRLILAVLASGFMASCETAIDINTGNQDVPIVYCVLNSADSFQYVRIQKTYLIDQAALENPPQQDSMLFTGEIVVTMERWSGGKVMETIRFAPTNEVPKDSGLIEVQADGTLETVINAPTMERIRPTWRFVASVARRIAGDLT
jgi:hypothetical protein